MRAERVMLGAVAVLMALLGAVGVASSMDDDRCPLEASEYASQRGLDPESMIADVPVWSWSSFSPVCHLEWPGGATTRSLWWG